ncbi:DNA-binding transcriptional regulator, AcrR family [Lentzea waywayandensis]|uniref:DNA-binding transcriptional regulator, AcrR family n=1 Tax=Lentzea waywayandensis TaxID=84724 RepID=A0A1I6E445_9PSEU|nr:TetR/AcrR family transcriptional regulator [Lentzea waywayandensis]SFR12417.1 DNA-binding transcriptional regulator, AcrR family [Lentzea waywayandensis]
MTESVRNPRERYRAQVRDEVKRHAWEQIATAGVTALSLNAIAKEMGMSGPALYRYFAGRDELITALIRDAYRSLADTVRAAHAAGTTAVALAAVIREWALSDPQRYLLIYGTPVPGYHAPDDITAISDEILAVLLEVCAGESEEPPKTPFDVLLSMNRGWAGALAASSPTVHRALSFWTRLQGVLSLELAGHLTPMGIDPGLLLAEEVAEL